MAVDKVNPAVPQPEDHPLALLNKEIHLHSLLHKCHLLPTDNISFIWLLYKLRSARLIIIGLVFLQKDIFL